jgi:hypothetical protein
MYRKIGFEIISDEERILKLADEIVKVGSSAAAGSTAQWEAALQAAVIGTHAFPHNKFVKGTTLEELTAMPFKAPFNPGSPGHNALVVALLLYLGHAGYTSSSVAAIRYHSDEHCTIEDVTRKILASEVVWPSSAEMNGDVLRWGQVIPLFTVFLRKVRSLLRFRLQTIERLRRKACDIGYNILKGRQPDEAERSFFLAIAPGGARALAVEEQDAPALFPAQNNDRLVDETWEVYKKIALSGPYTQFRELAVRQIDDSYLYYFGLPPTDLKVQFGVRFRLGSFTEFNLETAAQIPWTATSQLDAIAERMAPVHVRMDDAILQLDPPYQGGARGPEAMAMSCDHPEFELYYDDNWQDHAGKSISAPPPLSNFEVRYRSGLTSTLGQTATDTFHGPAMLVWDHVYSGAQLGGKVIGEQALPAGILIDTVNSSGVNFDSNEEAGALSADAPVESPGSVPGVFRRFGGLERIYLADSAKGCVRVLTVDLSPLITNAGELCVMPGLRDRVLCPRTWLYEDSPTAESFIVNRLALSEKTALVQSQCIRVSHNFAKLLQLFGPDAMPNLHPYLIAYLAVGWTVRPS